MSERDVTVTFHIPQPMTAGEIEAVVDRLTVAAEQVQSMWTSNDFGAVVFANVDPPEVGVRFTVSQFVEPCAEVAWFIARLPYPVDDDATPRRRGGPSM